jgi:D-2-hydroxyacid dehydrogenase (NADP+)
MMKNLNLGILYRRANTWWNTDLLSSTLKPYNIKLQYFDVTDQNDLQIPSNLDAVALLPSEADVLQYFLNKNKEIKWVHSMFAGVDKFLNIKDIFEKDSITLTNSRGAFADSIAEFGIFSMLYFYYNTPEYIAAYKDRKWIRPVNTMIKNKTLTIVGYGLNGACLAKKAKLGFDMHTIGLRNTLDNGNGKEYLDEFHTVDKLDEILPRTDFLVSCLPHTPETINFFNKDKFKLMHKNSVFINLGRGSSVVEQDLIEVLKSKSILGASLDVTQEEPLKSDSPLFDLDNLYLSFHSADNTTEYFQQAVDVLKKNVEMYTKEGKLMTVVDKKKGY